MMGAAIVKRIMASSGPPPDEIEFRYCPKDAGHWRSEGDRCPVCKSKIAVIIYAPPLNVKQAP